MASESTACQGITSSAANLDGLNENMSRGNASYISRRERLQGWWISLTHPPGRARKSTSGHPFCVWASVYRFRKISGLQLSFEARRRQFHLGNICTSISIFLHTDTHLSCLYSYLSRMRSTLKYKKTHGGILEKKYVNLLFARSNTNSPKSRFFAFSWWKNLFVPHFFTSNLDVDDHG